MHKNSIKIMISTSPVFLHQTSLEAVFVDLILLNEIHISQELEVMCLHKFSDIHYSKSYFLSKAKSLLQIRMRGIVLFLLQN